MNAGDILRRTTGRLPHVWCAAHGWHDPGLHPDEPHVSTWADGYGRWHAVVPYTGNHMADAAAARRAIRAQLAQRGEAHPNYRLRVSRERVTGHGTAVYVEA